MNTFDQHQYKKEQQKLKSMEAVKRFRQAAKAMRSPKQTESKKTSPEALERSAKWAKENPEKVKENRKRHMLKKNAESKDRVSIAIAQADATRRNVESIEDEEDV